MKKNIEVSLTPRVEFTPIEVNIKFNIQTLEQLRDLRFEASEGILGDAEIHTEYSGLLYDVFLELRNKILE